jgi:hypothetical protein
MAKLCLPVRHLSSSVFRGSHVCCCGDSSPHNLAANHRRLTCIAAVIVLHGRILVRELPLSAAAAAMAKRRVEMHQRAPRAEEHKEFLLRRSFDSC